jgi:hypothetical protein
MLSIANTRIQNRGAQYHVEFGTASFPSIILLVKGLEKGGTGNVLPVGRRPKRLGRIGSKTKTKND